MHLPHNQLQHLPEEVPNTAAEMTANREKARILMVVSLWADGEALFLVALLKKKQGSGNEVSEVG